MNSFKNFLLKLLILVFVFLPINSFSSTIDISGVIGSDTTWTNTDTIIVVGDVSFASSIIELTIQTGTVIMFSSGANLIIDGQLTAIGALADSIIFTSTADTVGGSPNYGDWSGIDFTANSDNFPCVMDYCAVRYAVDGININENQGTNALLITHSEIRNCSSRCLYISNSDPTITDCVIKNATSYAIYATGSQSELTLLNCDISQDIGSSYYKQGEGLRIHDAVTATVSGCSIHDFSTGVYLYYSPQIYMTNSSIYDNNGFGINNYFHTSGTMDGYIRYCSIINNGSFGFYTQLINSSSDASAATIDASYNWWGTTDGFEITSKIYNFFNNNNCPLVDFSSFLDGPDSSTANVVSTDYLQGNFTSDTTLSITGSPYQVLGARVMNGATMTLEPGVKFILTNNMYVDNGSQLLLNANDTLQFDNSNLYIDGQLTALGGIGDSIIFTSTADTIGGYPTQGDWGGIDFTANSDNLPSVMDYCAVRYAVDGIYIFDNQGANALLLTHSEISNCSNRCLYINSSDPTISDCVIKNATSYAIYATGSLSELTILNCDIYQDGSYYKVGQGLYLGNAVTATVSGCSIHDFSTGVYLQYSPQIYMTNSSVYDNNSYGINNYFHTSGTMDGYVRYCSIFNNGSYGFYTQRNGSSDASAATIDASYNWWGTTDGFEITSEIYDFLDYNLNPLVDFSSFLDGPDSSTANVVSTDFLQGNFTSDTTLSITGSPYEVLGARVMNGATMTLEPGVKFILTGNMLVDNGSQLILSANDTLQFDNSNLYIDGQLTALGGIGDSIIFTSTADTIGGYPTQGDWGGIDFTANSDNLPSVMDYCAVRYAVDGIYLNDNQGTNALLLTHSEISNCSSRCLHINNSDPTITDCVIKNATSYAIYVTGSPSELTLMNCDIYQDGSYYKVGQGLYLHDAVTATVSSCSIHDFSTGVYLHYSPQIYMTNSLIYDNNGHGINNYFHTSGTMEGYIRYCSIFNNGSYGFYTQRNGSSDASAATIDASYNWWGTTDGFEITSEIYDFLDYNLNPLVDFSSFLDGPDSSTANVVSTDFLQGNFTSDTTLSITGSPYEVLGARVMNGATMTLEPGVKFILTGNMLVDNGSQLILTANDTLQFDNSSLLIDGQLTALGGIGDSIIFTSTADTVGGYPTQGDWGGIDFTANSDNLPCVMDYCAVRYAVDGIYIFDNQDSDALLITHSEISDCSSRCLLISNSDPTITDCVIKNAPSSAIYVTGSLSELTLLNCDIYQDVVNSYYKQGQGIYLANQITATISGCSIHDFNTGVYIQYYPKIYMTNCSIYDNSSFGINNYYTTYAMFGYIRYCSIVNNGSYGFYTQIASTSDSIIDARYNWWGATDSISIADNSIYDKLDYGNSPLVQFVPFLTDPALERCPADFDFSGIVDHDDLLDFAFSFGSKPGYYNWKPICDISSIGSSSQRIDGLDLAILGSQFGKEGGCYTSSSVSNKEAVFDDVKIIIDVTENDRKEFISIYPEYENEVECFGISFDMNFDSSSVNVNKFNQLKALANKKGISYLSRVEEKTISIALVGLDYRSISVNEFQELLSFEYDEKNIKKLELTNLVLFIDNYDFLLNPKVEYNSSDNELIPKAFTLYQNYPNPFNPSTQISYDLPLESSISFSIYNVLGQKVWGLDKEREVAGNHIILWDGTDQSGQKVSSGVYLYRLEAGDFTATKKMMLLK